MPSSVNQRSSWRLCQAAVVRSVCHAHLKSKAMDLCLTARLMDANEAERAGLVSRGAGLDKLMEETMAAAAAICIDVLAGGDDD